MTITRTSTGKLRYLPTWSTGDLSNFTGNSNTAISGNRLQIGTDSNKAGNIGVLHTDSLYTDIADAVVHLQMQFNSSYSYTNNGYEVWLRYQPATGYKYYFKLNYATDGVTIFRQGTDGLQIVGDDPSFSVPYANPYQIKFSVQGTTLNASCWIPATQSEPSSWMWGFTDSNFSGVGDWGQRGFYKRCYVDQTALYKSSNVTCSGLPTGYKLRVGGASGKVAVESGGTATVNCSHGVTFPVDTVEVLDASNAVIETFTATDDVWGGDVYTFESPATTYQGNFTADAYLLGIIGGDFTVDAILHRVGQGSLTANAYLVKADSGNITRNSTGKLKREDWATNTLSNYSTTGTVTWNGTDKTVALGAELTNGQGRIRDANFSAGDQIITITVDHAGSYLTSNSLNNLTARLNLNTVNYYWLEFNKNTDQTELFVYDNSTYITTRLGVFDDALDRDKFYYVKFSLLGTTLKAKMWAVGTDEPASWQITTEDSTELTGGHWQIYSKELITKFGRIYIYNSPDITMTGLPTGYKLRVNGDPDFVATEVGGTATCDCQHHTFPVNLVEVLDASGNVVDTKYIQDDIWGGDQFTFTQTITTEQSSYNVDAVLKKVLTTPFDGDALLKKTVQDFINADAALVKVFQDELTADAVLKAVEENNFDGDAVLKTVLDGSFTADAELVVDISSVQGNFNVDAVLKQINQGDINGNAVLSKTLEGSLTADVVLKNILDGSYTTDAVFTKTLDGSYTADTVLSATQEGNYTAAAMLMRSYQVDFNADVVLKAAREGELNADAILQKVNLTPFNADGVLKKSVTGQANVDALLQTVTPLGGGAGTIERTSSGFIRKETWDSNNVNNGTYTLDDPITYNSATKDVTIGADSSSGLGGFYCYPPTFGTDLPSTYIFQTIFKPTSTYLYSSSSAMVVYFHYKGSQHYRVLCKYNSNGSDGSIELYDGSTNSTISGILPFAWEPGAAYRFKIKVVNENDIYVKAWKDGTTELTDWFITATRSNITGGGWGIISRYKQTVNDDNYFYSSPNVTVTGLPTGYKLRVGGVVAVESAGTATADCSNILFPVDTVEVLKADDTVDATFTDTGNIYGGDSYSYTPGTTVDTIGRGFWVDTYLGEPAVLVESQFKTDAVLKNTINPQFLVNAALKKTENRSFDISSVLKKVNQDELDADAVLKATKESTLDSDAVFKKSLESDYTADAVLKHIVQGSFDADALLQKVIELDFTSDTVFQKVIEQSLYADAVLHKSIQGNFMADAEFVAISQISGSFNANAVLRKAGIESSFAADAGLERVYNVPFDADAVLKKTLETPVTVDAMLQAVKASDLKADAVFVKPVTSNYTTDSVLKSLGVQGSFMVDANLGTDGQVTYELERTGSGFLFVDRWEADHTNSYTKLNATWRSTYQTVRLGTGSASGYLINESLPGVSDYVLTTKVDFVQSGSDNKSRIYIRYGSGKDYYYANFDFIASTLTLYYRISGSTTSTIGEATIDTSPCYVKFYAKGNDVKVKVWRVSDPEPNAWNIENTKTMSNPGVGTAWDTALNINDYDDFVIYDDKTISCTNLPTGYKLRVGGIAAAEVSGTATVDCSHVFFPLNQVELLDATDTVVHTFTATGDVWGGDTYNAKAVKLGLFTADAVLIKVRQGQFDANAVLKKTVPGNITARAVLRRSVTANFTGQAALHKLVTEPVTLDAVLTKIVSGSYRTNAVLRKLDLTGYLYADAMLQDVKQGGFTGQAALVKAIDGNYPADAVLLKHGVTGSFTADTMLAGVHSGSLNVDVVLSKTWDKDFAADAILIKAVNHPFEVYSVFKGVCQGSFTADADLQPFATREGSFAVYSVLLKSVPGSLAADAVLRQPVTGQTSANAVLSKTLAGSVASDATLKRIVAGTITAVSVLKGLAQGSFTVDAVFRKADISGQFNADAMFMEVMAYGLQAHSVLQKAVGKLFSTDAAITTLVNGNFTVGAVMRQTFYSNFTVNAITVMTPVLLVSADTVLFRIGQSGGFTANAVFFDPEQNLVDVSLAVQKVFSITTTLQTQYELNVSLTRKVDQNVQIRLN